jgi:hypothetical protein
VFFQLVPKNVGIILILLPLVAILGFAPQVYAVGPTMAIDSAVTSGAVTSTSCYVNSYGYTECRVHSAFAILTTAHINDVIVIVAQCGLFGDCNNNISSIVDGGSHVWRLRAAYTPSYMGVALRPIWEYYTGASSPLSSDRIEVTWSGSGGVPANYYSFVALGISGANIQHPWDPSPKLPVENTGFCAPCNPLQVSTVAAQDLVIVTVAIADGPSCNDLWDISPFQFLYGFGGGGAGEIYYFITNRGGANSVSFTCQPNAFRNVISILGDALQGPGSQH